MAPQAQRSELLPLMTFAALDRRPAGGCLVPLQRAPPREGRKGAFSWGSELARDVLDQRLNEDPAAVATT